MKLIDAIGQREEHYHHPIEKKDEDEESSAYSLFVYAVRSHITRDYYLRRLRFSLIILIYFPKERQWNKDAIYMLICCKGSKRSKLGLKFHCKIPAVSKAELKTRNYGSNTS
jgi:hypothetical protein